MSRNRRRHSRVPARGLAAHLRSQHGRFPCVVENVSVGGLFVRTDRLHEVGEELFAGLVRPGWKKQLTLAVRVTSRVDALDGRLSQRPPGMGLQFLGLDGEQHQRLRSLLRELGAPADETEVTLPDDASAIELQAIAPAIPGSAEPAIAPAVAGPDEPPPAAGSEPARLMMQIRGLIMQLSEAQLRLHRQDGEIERLRAEAESLRAALARAAGTT